MSAIMAPSRSKIAGGQIARADSERLSALLKGDPRRTDWKAIGAILRTYHPNEPGAPDLESLLRRALDRSCLDPSGVSVGTVRLLLQKTKRLSPRDRLRCASAAVRCRNGKVLRALIDSDASVLFRGARTSGGDDRDGSATTELGKNSPGVTLLHVICEEHGWNDEIAFVLDQILRNNGNKNKNNTNDDDDENDAYDDGSGSGKYTHHEGLFQETPGSEMPLKLSLQAGADLKEILDHTRMQHPSYIERNLDRLSQIVAEYSNDMTVFSDLVDAYGTRLLDGSHPKDGSTPLAFACYYQNEDMIRLLLEEYRETNHRWAEVGERGPSEKRNPGLGVRNRLVSRNNEGTTPLGHLLLSVGDPDAENAWRCIHACIDFFCDPGDNGDGDDIDDIGRDGDHERQRMSRSEQQRFPVLHLFLLHAWDALVAKKNCIEILERIVERLGIDLCVVDAETGTTVLSVVIEKLSADSLVVRSGGSGGAALRILDFVTTSAAPPPMVPWNPNPPAKNHHRHHHHHRPATTRDAAGRLPLHSACERSLPWKRGLETVVHANVPALESTDPITRLPPFAHCAVGPGSDLDSVYELLRLNPGVMDSVLPTSSTSTSTSSTHL